MARPEVVNAPKRLIIKRQGASVVLGCSVTSVMREERKKRLRPLRPFNKRDVYYEMAEVEALAHEFIRDGNAADPVAERRANTPVKALEERQARRKRERAKRAQAAQRVIPKGRR
jgi:hypothetical protein